MPQGLGYDADIHARLLQYGGKTVPCDIGRNGRLDLQTLADTPQGKIHPAAHFMHSILLLHGRNVYPLIQYREQIGN